MGNTNKKDKTGKKKKAAIQCVVLGIAASGKSTFTRQLRVIHQIQFTGEELANFKRIIRSNVVQGMHETVGLAQRNNLQLQEKNIKYGRYLDTVSKEADTESVWANEKFVPRLKSLWADPAIITAWEGADATLSNLDFFLKKIDTIAALDYVPNQDDIFRARQRTAGAATTEFVTNKHYWSFKDAGGQPYERKLWPSIIASGLHAIMFFVALDEYDCPSDANPSQTKMQDSLEAWRELFTIQSVKDSCVLLFLNKHDLFESKFGKDSTSFKKHFPDYNGSSVDDGLKAVSDLYLENVPDDNLKSSIFVSVVTALDTSLVKTVFEKVRVHVVRQRMHSSGLLVV